MTVVDTPALLAVITAAPTARAVTTPESETVATDGLPESHVNLGAIMIPPLEFLAVAVSGTSAPASTSMVFGARVIDARSTVTVTATKAVLDAAANRPTTPAADAVTVIVAVPARTAVITPLVATVAMLGSEVP